MQAQEQILQEQATVLEYSRNGKNIKEIAELTGLSYWAARRRLKAAEKREALDPTIRTKLQERGLVDFGGLKRGWLIERDKGGSGSSLYFDLGPDEEPISVVEALKEVLHEIPRLDPVPAPKVDPSGKDYATWLFLADLHVGAEYGYRESQKDFHDCIDDLVARMPPAEKAIICELGDLLDANDHKAATPGSGNPTDTYRDNHLENTKMAIRLMKYATYRCLQVHQEVEVHMIRGNHDETAFFAVMLALEEHFMNDPRVSIVVPQTPEEEEFRVVKWGKTAFFPHHGDKAKPIDLKDIWNSQFEDEWAYAKAFRLIATAHFHHLKASDLPGCLWRQFRTIHKPNRWARLQGFFSFGTLTVLTVHKERGLEFETHSNVKMQRKISQ